MEPLAYVAFKSVKHWPSEAHSALPDAPVVIEVDREPVTVRLRAGAASRLHRLADAVAPAQPSCA